MNALMKEYLEKWYVLAVCVFLIFPGMTAGFAAATAIWGFRAMTTTSVAEFIVFGLVTGVVSTLPVQLQHIILYRRGVSKTVLAIWSTIWIFVFALIGLVILIRM
ncbi:MAG: hypothetical protein FWE92_02205 [Defluviitaleaceae bacterium]|nr:hypothetical protein [Defluviitaleaceae bacterium]